MERRSSEQELLHTSTDKVNEAFNKVNEELKEHLVKEGPGSPAMRAYGNLAAESYATYLVDVTPDINLSYYRHTAQLIAVLESKRIEEMGHDADLFDDARKEARTFLNKYVEAAKRTQPRLSEIQQKGAGALSMMNEVRYLNIHKARMQRTVRRI